LAAGGIEGRGANFWIKNYGRSYENPIRSDQDDQTASVLEKWFSEEGMKICCQKACLRQKRAISDGLL